MASAANNCDQGHLWAYLMMQTAFTKILGGDQMWRQGRGKKLQLFIADKQSVESREHREERKEGKGRGVICKWAEGGICLPQMDDMLGQAVSPKAKVG